MADAIPTELVDDALTPELPEPELTAKPITAEVVEPDPPAATGVEPAATAAAAPGLDVRNIDGAKLIPGTELPIVPEAAELAGLAQLAVTLSAAAIVPAALRGKPNDVLLVLLSARDLGVAITTALREFHVIDGKVTLSPKVKLALVRQSGLGRIYPHQPPRTVTVRGRERRVLCPCGQEDGPNDHLGAIWHAERADEPGILHSSRFTAEDAARPTGCNALTGKDNWQNYPQRMMSWRALGYLLDDVFPEVGTGLYSPDELGAVTDDEGEPIIDVVGSAAPLSGMSAPRGHNRPAPEPEPAATEEELTALRARIDALPAGGRAALRDLWTRTPEDGGPPSLPPLGKLSARQLPKADAMVKSIELRAGRGEWADEAPQDAQEPQEGPEAAAEELPATDGPQDVDDAQDDPPIIDPATTDGPAIPAEHRDPDEDVDAGPPTRPSITADVTALDLRVVRRELADRGLRAAAGPPAYLRAVLAADLMAEHELATEVEVAELDGIRTATIELDAADAQDAGEARP
jgi:hypothetical protein